MLEFSPAGESGHGNGAAVFITLTVARDDSRKEAHDWVSDTSVFPKREQLASAGSRFSVSSPL